LLVTLGVLALLALLVSLVWFVSLASLGSRFLKLSKFIVSIATSLARASLPRCPQTADRSRPLVQHACSALLCLQASFSASQQL
jgi:hypothetical protein